MAGKKDIACPLIDVQTPITIWIDYWQAVSVVNRGFGSMQLGTVADNNILIYSAISLSSIAYSHVINYRSFSRQTKVRYSVYPSSLRKVHPLEMITTVSDLRGNCGQLSDWLQICNRAFG
jgi:hypothetical protein